MNEFSRALAGEVTLLLQEVGKLREEKRNIQHEIGCLQSLKQKYNPGGIFDPDWFALFRESPLHFLTSISGLLQMVIPTARHLCRNRFNHLRLRYPQRSDPRGDRFRKGRDPVVQARDTPKRLSSPRQLFPPHHHRLPLKRCHLSTLPCLRFRLCPLSRQWQQCSLCSHVHQAHRVQQIEQLWQRAGVLGDVSVYSWFFLVVLTHPLPVITARSELGPSPPPRTPLFEVPDVRPPGLFGPRSPRKFT